MCDDCDPVLVIDQWSEPTSKHFMRYDAVRKHRNNASKLILNFKTCRIVKLIENVGPKRALGRCVLYFCQIHQWGCLNYPIVPIVQV